MLLVSYTAFEGFLLEDVQHSVENLQYVAENCLSQVQLKKQWKGFYWLIQLKMIKAKLKRPISMPKINNAQACEDRRTNSECWTAEFNLYFWELLLRPWLWKRNSTSNALTGFNSIFFKWSATFKITKVFKHSCSFQHKLNIFRKLFIYMNTKLSLLWEWFHKEFPFKTSLVCPHYPPGNCVDELCIFN